MLLRSLYTRIAQSHITRGYSTVAEHAVKTTGISLLHQYEALVKAGSLQPDVGQAAVVNRLQDLATQLHAHSHHVADWGVKQREYSIQLQKLRPQLIAQELAKLENELQQYTSVNGNNNTTTTSSSSPLQSLFSWFSSSQQQQEDGKQTPVSLKLKRQQLHSKAHETVDQIILEKLGPPPSKPTAPRGLYIHGPVGSGKTALLDHFYSYISSLPAVEPSPHAEDHQHQQKQQQKQQPTIHVKRVHFNAALLELHTYIHHIETAYRENPELTDEIKRAKAAKLHLRRVARERLQADPEQYAQHVAAANATVMLDAARQFFTSTNSGSTSTSGSGSGNTSIVSAGRSSGSGRSDRKQGGVSVLCFDEVQVTDPFNAALFKALVEAAVEDGIVLVATSNRAPWELARHGLHEGMFEHFLETLQASCDHIDLSHSPDYRRYLYNTSPSTTSSTAAAVPSSSSSLLDKCFFTPLGTASEAAMEAAWETLLAATTTPNTSNTTTDKHAVNKQQEPMILPVLFGRSLTVHRHLGGPTTTKAAWFTFEELCARPLGASDYISIAKTFNTVFISNIPHMSMKSRDKARRFITLVDELYNYKVRLVCSADTTPDGLFATRGEEALVSAEELMEGLESERATESELLSFRGGGKALESWGGREERFAFARAASRLMEMQSGVYLSNCKGSM